MSNEKIIALAERDVKKAERALRNAETRPNIPPDELEHIKELLELRKEILKACEILYKESEERNEQYKRL